MQKAHHDVICVVTNDPIPDGNAVLADRNDGTNDELFDYIDTPKLRELYLAWCGENGFEPIAIGAAA
jgi:hypothetical protein